MTPSEPTPPEGINSHRWSLVLMLTLFFSWGFLNALNDVLVAEFRAIFTLSYRSATLVEFSFFLTCFVIFYPSSVLLSKLRHKRTMVVGLLVMALGAVVFVGASAGSGFNAFLSALVVMASGSTVLQTAAAPFVALLGPESSSSSRFSFALGVNSLGAMLGPLFGAGFLLRNVQTKSSTILAFPFSVIAGSLFLLAVCVGIVRWPRIKTVALQDRDISYRALFAKPQFSLGVLSILLYVGAEVSIGSLMINFLSQTYALGLSTHSAALYATLYWAGSMAGRFLGGFILTRSSSHKIQLACTGSAFVLVLIAIVGAGPLAGASLLAVGLCNSMMVPILYTGTLAQAGPDTSKAPGVLVGALIGGAIVPVCQGGLADRYGLQDSFALPAMCYVAIGAYAWFMIRTNLRLGGLIGQVGTRRP
jgi:FHS family L-fucose permease-like MFS transporter